MRTVKPITSRQDGELSRLLEERGFGSAEYQKRLIENIDKLVEWARSGEETYLVTVHYEGGRSREVKIGLRYFGYGIPSNQVISELEKWGLFPVTEEELKALAESHPELTRRFPIAGLGDVECIGGSVCGFEYIARYGRVRRRRRPGQSGRAWPPEYRFAFVFAPAGK